MDLPESGRVLLIVPGIGADTMTMQPFKLILGINLDTRLEDFVHRTLIQASGTQLGLCGVPGIFQSREMRLQVSKSDPAEPADALKRYPIWKIIIHDSKLSIYPTPVKARLY